jgi:hypothetical protein
MLLCWVWPQHGLDRLVREASDEHCASHRTRQDVGTGWLGEGTPGNGLCRPGVDEAEGAEAQGGPGVNGTLWPSIQSAGEVHRDTQCAPTWRTNYRGSLPSAVNFY